ncbi:MAG: hypothetical protein U0841_31035, partial [Chloroflexia bacterium]
MSTGTIVQSGHLVRHVAYWPDYPADWQAAIVDLLRPSYLAKAFPSRASFAAERGLDATSPECLELWEEVQRDCVATLAHSYAPTDFLYTILATQPGAPPIALATMMWARGARGVPIAESVGDARSSLPTHRMLSHFRFPDDLGFDPWQTPESALVEYGRLCVRRPADLANLVAQGRVASSSADYIRRLGSSEVLAGTYFTCQERDEPPVAILYNTPARLAEWLREKGLVGRPLYEGTGTEPTPRIVNGPLLVRRTFDWWPHLAPVVPPTYRDQGIAAAVCYLAAQSPG